MIHAEVIGDRTLEIRVDAKVVRIVSDPNVHEYLLRIARNNGLKAMVNEAISNGLSVSEYWAN